MFSMASVCLFVNTITSKRLNVGWCNLAVKCIVQKSRPSSNLGLIGPHAPKCGGLLSHYAKINKRMWAWQARQWTTPPHALVNK